MVSYVDPMWNLIWILYELRSYMDPTENPYGSHADPMRILLGSMYDVPQACTCHQIHTLREPMTNEALPVRAKAES